MKKSAEPANVMDWLEKPVRRSPAAAYLQKDSSHLEMVSDISYEKTRAISNRDLYAPNIDVPAMLQPQAVVPEYFMSNFEKAGLVQQGISKTALEHFKLAASLDYTQLAALLSSARNTLINKKGDEVFSYDVSEKLVALAEVYTHGLAVFESMDAFNGWLREPNNAVAGSTPFSLLGTQYGRNEVHALLGRIEWGVYS